MHIGLHGKCPLFVPDFNENWFFSRHLLKIRKNIEFHDNPSSGSRVVPCGRTDRMNLIVAYRNLRKQLQRKGENKKIKRPIRWLVDRKNREVANLLIELNSNKSYDFQNYRRTDRQLFQNSLLVIRSIGGKRCNESCCTCKWKDFRHHKTFGYGK